MAGWHYWCKGHQLRQTPRDGEGQGGLACCSPWGRKESDWLGDWITTRYSCLVKLSQTNTSISILLVRGSKSYIDIVGWCYRLKCVLPKFTCWNSMPKVLGGSPWEVTKSWGQSPQEQDCALIKEVSYNSLALLPQEYTVKSNLQLEKQPSPECENASTLILDFQPPELWE